MAFTQWTSDGTAWSPSSQTTPRLNPGLYRIQMTMMGPQLITSVIKHDNIIMVEDGLSSRLLDGIHQFWKAKERYSMFGLLHKRGILMYGDPGTGKTMAAIRVAEEIAKIGGISIIHQPDNDFRALGWMLRAIRSIHPEMPILVVMEDIDAIEEDHYLLSLLDGEDQVGNIVFLATTNYLDNLDPRLTNRPSRFDEVVEVGAPTEAARRSYFEQIVPRAFLTNNILDSLVKESDNLLLCHLRELVASALAMGKPIPEVASKLKEMHGRAVKAKDDEEEKKANGTWTAPPVDSGKVAAEVGKSIANSIRRALQNANA